jgi:cob(I)alamin adenosyltransferase
MLYTRKGDNGDTYLFGSEKRISKSSCQTEVLGSLDELNSILGICRAKLNKESNVKFYNKTTYQIIENIQQDLFTIQAEIAGADKQITEAKIKLLETIINSIEKELKEIKTFFLPGASELSSFLDYARAIARKTERRIVKYSEENKISPFILQYINRLSSLLYALVRIINFKLEAEEIRPSYS